MVMLPAAAGSRPAKALSSVDFPMPDAPLICRNSPCASVKERWAMIGASSAGRPPDGGRLIRKSETVRKDAGEDMDSCGEDVD